MYPLSLYRKVVVENGTLVQDTSAGYVCSLHVSLNNGVWKDICVKPSSSQASLYNYNTSMSKDGATLD